MDNRIKPLLITLPVLIILAALVIFDGGISSHEEKNFHESRTLELVIGQVGDIVNDSGAPVFAAPNTESEQIAALQYNCCVLKSTESTAPDGWIAVDITKKNDESTVTGYVSEENVVTEDLTISCDNQTRWNIIDKGLSYLGLRFVKYGKSLTNGIDCSNFLNQVFASCGVDIPNTPNSIRDASEQISLEQAIPGDLVYYYVNEGGGHVGLYLGGGFQLNCSGHSGRAYPEGGVRITKIQYKDREAPYMYRILEDE